MEEEDSGASKFQDTSASVSQYENERPLFHSNQRPPGPSEPFLVSGSDVKVPYTINRYLRDYQRDGIKFIYYNYAKSRGCILGDDMGLGKTVQVIGFLAAVLRKTGTWEDVENNRPQFLLSQKSPVQPKVQKVFLIVAPLSLLYNWKDELDTWGHFRVAIVHGVRKEEELVRVQRGRCEVALTTYETFRLCLDQFNSIDWAAVIVDEAHKIKNHKSQITQAMKEMRCKVRVGLTGTILQNNLEEMWCVMDWAIPGCLGSLVGFKNRFSDPIEQGQKHTVTKRALAEGRKAVKDMAKKLSRWFLRRTKTLISDQLPKKDDRVVYCSLTDFQQTVYQAVLDTDDVTLLLQSSGKCPCGSGRPRKKCCYKLNADGVPVRYLYFSYLAILRKVANHVALLQSREGTSKKQEKYVTAICERVFRKFPDFTERCKQAAFEAMSDPMYSGKMKVLQKLLNHFIVKKDNVLLFSLSTKLLDVLESYCMAEGLEYRRLDGNTKSKDRVKIVREFNSSRDINLCLVSTLAGGLGLNFVGANAVVLFDPTWNPANDLQAIDRAYRIGQCRDVTVFRLISLGTVEEIIYLRQIYKQQLQTSVIGCENARRYFEAVQGTDGQAGELFGIRNLFRLQTDGTCLTHRILEREGRVEVGMMTAKTQALDERMQEAVSIHPFTDPCLKRFSFPPDSPIIHLFPRYYGEHMVIIKPLSKPMVETTQERTVYTAFIYSGEALSKFFWNEPHTFVFGEDGGSQWEPVLLGYQYSSKYLLQKEVIQDPKSADASTERAAEVLDFSSASEDEDHCCSRQKASNPHTGEDMGPGDSSIGNIGLYRLLQQHIAQREQQQTDSSEEDSSNPTEDEENQEKPSHSEEMKEVPAGKHHGSRKLTKSEHTSHVVQQMHMESADLEVLPPKFHKRNDGMNAGRSCLRKGVKFTEKRSEDDIERFSSSEDEERVKCRNGSSHQRQNTKQRSVRFTGLKNQNTAKTPESDKTHGRDEGNTGTVDSLLGGLQHVSYTHSNQKVVGSSRAEDRLSRAAVRDVFELNKHSQLPANQLLDISETPSQSCESVLTDHSTGRQTLPACDRPHKEYPVTHFIKTSHRHKNITFIVGETPSSICRNQLEDMARFFGAVSVQGFAEEILKSDSAQRLSRLRSFYSQKSPELKDIIKKTFPKPNAEPKPPTSTPPSTSGTARQRPTSKRALPNAPQVEVPAPAVEDQRETSKKKRISVTETSEVHHRHSTDLTNNIIKTFADDSDQSMHRFSSFKSTSSGHLQRSCAPVEERRTNGRRSLIDKEHSSCLVSTRDCEASSSTQTKSSLITDLIGDTSILNDLFKSKKKPLERPREATVLTHAEKAKSRGKDFWDILNEGNEESINKLTDLSEVEKICNTVSVSAKSKSNDESQSSQLWKKNEKFLWKIE